MPAKGGITPYRSQLPTVVQKRIREMLEAGTRHLTQVAKACGVSTCVVKRMVESDPELKALHDAAYEEKMEDVEDAMFDMAVNGDNEVAKEKAQEYLLRYRRPKTYSPDLCDQAASGGTPTKRIVIVPVMPVTPCDANGIPIQPKQEPKQAEVIDV